MTFSNKTYIMFGSLAIFIVISVLSLQNRLTTIDQAIISSLTGDVSPFVASLMEAVTKLGSGEIILIITFIIAAILFFKKLYTQIVFLFTLTFGGIALNFFLKILFQRERPGEMSVIEVFGYSLEIASYSFPSGHTMRSVLLFTFLIYMSYYFIKNNTTKIGAIVIFSLMIIIISLSRIIVGAHFPSDIIAAVTISITWFYLCLILIQRLPIDNFINKFKK